MADLEIGPVVRALRERAGISQAALADAAGIDSRNTISRLERGGVGAPRLETLQAIASALGTDTWRIVRCAEKAQRAAESGGAQYNEKEGEVA